MSTKKNRFVIVSVRVGFFPIWLLLPLRCLNEVVEGFSDIISLFRWAGRKAYDFSRMAEAALLLVQSHGPLDLVDADIRSSEGRVKIKILMR